MVSVDRMDRDEQHWEAVDNYLVQTLITEDEALRTAREGSAQSSMPNVEVTPNQGAFLGLLAQLSGARRVLELGTLTGYSTIWLARASEQVTTIELDPGNAALARKHFELAGVADRIELRIGAAAQELETLINAGVAPYDLVFIDADKPNNPVYLAGALRLSHPGTIIVVDNVVRDGKVADPTSTNEAVLGVRRLLDMIAADPRLDATALQTVGSKGWDGFALIRVR